MPMFGPTSAKHRRYIGGGWEVSPVAVLKAPGEPRREELARLGTAELLAEAEAAGLSCFADGDRLVLRGPRDAEQDLVQTLLCRKAELVPLLRPPASPPVQPLWDRAEADRLLADLRTAVDQARASFGKPFPATLEALVSDAIGIAEGFVANHELEAARGWDALGLLRKVKPGLLAAIARVKAAPACRSGVPKGRGPDEQTGPPPPAGVPPRQGPFAKEGTAMDCPRCGARAKLVGTFCDGCLHDISVPLRMAEEEAAFQRALLAVQQQALGWKGKGPDRRTLKFEKVKRSKNGDKRRR
jgi:hypothetical protein